MFWKSNNFADHLSLFHWEIAASSSGASATGAVGAGVPVVAIATGATGHGVVSSKWPQYSFASTPFWKQRKKIAQLRPEALSFGMDNERILASVVAVTAEVNIEHDERVSAGVIQRRAGQNNL